MKPWYALVGLLWMSLTPLVGHAQFDTFKTAVSSVTARIEPAEAVPGQTVTLFFTMNLNDGWHTYPTIQPDEKASGQINRFTFPKTGDLIFVDAIQDPANFELKPEPKLQIEAMRVYHHTAEWQRKAVVSPKAAAGQSPVKITAKLLVCDKNRCLPPEKITVEAGLTINAGSQPVEAAYAQAVNQALTGEAVPPMPAPMTTPNVRTNPMVPPQVDAPKAVAVPIPSGPRDHAAELASIQSQLVMEDNPVARNSNLWTLLATAAAWGWISLVTPCVFPMIPITVSIFLKKGEKDGGNPVLQAIIYSLTIIIVLGTSAFTLLSVFQELSINPWMNLFLGGLFIFFALSLFGMYEITLPNFLTRFTGSRERSGGVLGTIFMALTFTIISFTCVAPFLGGFSGMIAQGNFSRFELFLAGLVFATAFASPFFVLALFPGMLKKMPRAGSWMNSVKVVMGFLELAASLKFLRTAELRFLPEPTYFTYDLVLGLWVTIAIFCGIYLLNLFRLPHDDDQGNIPVPRMIMGIAFVGFGFYLLPGLFSSSDGVKQRPSGIVYSWVDAFLLPEPMTSESEKVGPWSTDLYSTIAQARAERTATGKPQFVFVDFTGVTCTNCKINERSVFPRPDVEKAFKPFKLVQMYTDEVPIHLFVGDDRSDDARDEQAQLNRKLQKDGFGTVQLPLYVILEPRLDGKIQVYGPYAEGQINNKQAFIDFLKKPFTAPKPATTTAAAR